MGDGPNASREIPGARSDEPGRATRYRHFDGTFEVTGRLLLVGFERLLQRQRPSHQRPVGRYRRAVVRHRRGDADLPIATGQETVPALATGVSAPGFTLARWGERGRSPLIFVHVGWGRRRQQHHPDVPAVAVDTGPAIPAVPDDRRQPID